MSKGRAEPGRKNKWYQFKGLGLGAHLAYLGSVVTRSMRGRAAATVTYKKWQGEVAGCCRELGRSPCCIVSCKQPQILTFILNCQFFNIAFEKQDVIIGHALELILGALQTAIGRRMRVQIGRPVGIELI